MNGGKLRNGHMRLSIFYSLGKYTICRYLILCSQSTASYGNPSQMPTALAKKYKTFADNFVVSFAPQILSVYLEQANLYVTGQAWLSKRAMYFIGQFFSEW